MCPQSSYSYFSNYELPIRNADSLDPGFENEVSACDVFIYQPLSPQWGVYSTELSAPMPSLSSRSLIAALPVNARALSFPYIFNDALWPVFREGDKWKNIEALIPYVRTGLTHEQFLSLYRENLIDFRYEERMARSLRILYERSTRCDIQVYSYVIHSLHQARLFRTQNHPDKRVMLYLASRFAEALGYPVLPSQINLAAERIDSIMSDMPGIYPNDHSSVVANKILCKECIEESQSAASMSYWEQVVSEAYASLVGAS